MYAITGGAGFIGSNLAAGLEERFGDDILICDPNACDDRHRNIEKRRRCSVVKPEALFDALAENAQNIKAVFHLGAISDTTATDRDLIVKTNIVLSQDLWKWCTVSGVPFIYASSAATYGDGSQGFDDDPSAEALARLQPLNLYGWSKNTFDREVIGRIAAAEAQPPQWVGLKFFNVYGPNEYHKGAQKSVVAHIFPDAAAGNPAKLFKSHHPDYADGGQLRDFVWVGDCVNLMLWFLDNPGSSGLFNCGTGQARSFKDLAETVYRALGKEPMIDYVPTPENIRGKYQYFTEATLDRLRAAGYTEAFTSLEDGVTRYVQKYLNTSNPYQ